MPKKHDDSPGALQQNGLTGGWEVPNEAVKRSAERLLIKYGNQQHRSSDRSGEAMTPALVDVVVQGFMFVGLSGEATVEPKAAVALIESMADVLSGLSEEEFQTGPSTATASAQRAQGAVAAKYSKAMKKRWALE